MYQSSDMTQEMLEVANKERIAFAEQMEQEERIQVCTLILYLFVVDFQCVCGSFRQSYRSSWTSREKDGRVKW